jgi:hypothetical protein
VEENAPAYVKAQTKFEKTKVIADLIDRIREDSPDGGFIKKDFYSGRWFEIGLERTRDKVGHAVRKAADKLVEQKEGHKPKKGGKAKAAAKELHQKQRSNYIEDESTKSISSSQYRNKEQTSGTPASTLFPSSADMAYATSYPERSSLFQGTLTPPELRQHYSSLSQHAVRADSLPYAHRALSTMVPSIHAEAPYHHEAPYHLVPGNRLPTARASVLSTFSTDLFLRQQQQHFRGGALPPVPRFPDVRVESFYSGGQGTVGRGLSSSPSIQPSSSAGAPNDYVHPQSAAYYGSAARSAIGGGNSVSRWGGTGSVLPGGYIMEQAQTAQRGHGMAVYLSEEANRRGNTPPA